MEITFPQLSFCCFMMAYYAFLQYFYVIMVNQRYNLYKTAPNARLLFCGDEACAPSHEFGGSRPYFMVHVVLSGKGKFFWERKSWDLSVGDAFAIFPDERHHYRANENDPWHYFWIAFDKSIVPFLMQKGISQAQPILFTENIEELEKLYRILITKIENGKPIQELDEYAVAYRIMANLLSPHTKISAAPSPTPSSPVKFDHAQSMIFFIDSYYQTSLSVLDVADYVHLERTYASRLFKEKTGLGIAGYIRNRRLEKSKEFLTEGYSIKQAAYSSGFQIYENYLKNFKKRFGETPSEFRSH
jgi:AraC-like DNA-binding protein